MSRAPECVRLGAITGAVFALGFVLYVATGHDDAYITYWASHSLASSGEILNYNGERVEQSSSLLHTVLLAALARTTGASIVALGYWTAVAGGVLTVLRAPALARALGAEAPLLVATFTATTPVLLYWAFAGLETTLAAWLLLEMALLGAALLAGRRRPMSALALLATLAFVCVRPEAALVLGAALLAWLALAALRGGAAGARPLALWLVALVLLFAGVMAFRLAYFGAPFPQPVLAKTGGYGAAHLAAGLGYLTKLVTRPLAVPLLAVVLAAPLLGWREWAAHRPHGALWLVLLLIGAQLGFAVAAGGDSMIGGRFFVAPCALAVAALAAALAEYAPRLLRSRSLVAAALALQLAGVASLAFYGTGRPLWVWWADDRSEPGLNAAHWSERANLVHLRDLRFCAELLPLIARLLPHQERVHIASVQAGMVLYYTALRFGDRIEFHDLKGLATRDFSFLRGAAGVGGNSWGIDLDLPRYFELAARYPEPAFHPDLIFDIRPQTELAARHGYAVVLEQARPGLRLRGPVPLYQWAALRADRLR